MRALEGIKILDLSRTGPGQSAVTTLADMGADVIAIGQPGFAARRAAGGSASATFGLSVGRNKRGLLLNLNDERGKEIFYRLVRDADVVMESFRPGVVKRLGVDYDTLKTLNPNIIYLSLSGFGQEGPYATLAGHDMNYESVGGMLVEDSDGRPQIPSSIWADRIATFNATIGILMGLVSRQRLGRGQYIDVAFVDGAVTLGGSEGDPMLAGYYPCYNIYKTKDNKYVSLGIREPWFWERLCDIVGKPEWKDKQRPEGDLRTEIFEFLNETFLTKTRDDWFAILQEHDTEAAPVNQKEDVTRDPHLLHRKLIIPVERPDGTQGWQSGIPFRMSETPGSIWRTRSFAGQDTDEILRELGYNQNEADTLKKENVVEVTTL